MFNRYLLTTFLLLLTTLSFAAEKVKSKHETLQDNVIKNFISWDTKLKTLDTFYTQETSFEGTLISKTEGHLRKYPQRLRLEILEEGKVIQYAETDKKTIDIFDNKGNLIMQMPWENWQAAQQNKSLFDFGNYAKILEKHKVNSFEVVEQGYILVLTPKEGDQYTLTFLLDKNYFPKEINLLNEGVNSKTVLQKTKINKDVPKEISK